MTKAPEMFDSQASFADITLTVDPIDRKRSDGSDNVMAMFHEEQPVWWEFARPYIDKAVSQTNGEIDLLDVGTGSGVLAILTAKHTSAKNIVAVDKSARAIAQAKKNATQNGVQFKLQNEFYNMNSAPYHSCKVIAMNAPYHLYPAGVEMMIPQHARGGIDGQQVFREELAIANYHLASGGIIAFHQMCLGRDGQPEFVRYIPHLVKGVSLAYTNIFPAMKTREFLQSVYGKRFSEYQRETAHAFPELYFCDGIIRRDGKGGVQEIAHHIDLKKRSWQDRIKLHREIAKHGGE